GSRREPAWHPWREERHYLLTAIDDRRCRDGRSRIGDPAAGRPGSTSLSVISRAPDSPGPHCLLICDDQEGPCGGGPLWLHRHLRHPPGPARRRTGRTVSRSAGRTAAPPPGRAGTAPLPGRRASSDADPARPCAGHPGLAAPGPATPGFGGALRRRPLHHLRRGTPDHPAAGQPGLHHPHRQPGRSSPMDPPRERLILPIPHESLAVHGRRRWPAIEQDRVRYAWCPDPEGDPGGFLVNVYVEWIRSGLADARTAVFAARTAAWPRP